MSNKPMPLGSRFHDASDPRCERHAVAVLHKAIPVRAERVCPMCKQDKLGGYSKPPPIRKSRTRRRVTRAAA